MPKTLRAERADRPRQASIVVKFIPCSRDDAMNAGDDEVELLLEEDGAQKTSRY